MVAVINAEGEVAGGLTAQAIDRTCRALGWGDDRSHVRRIVDLGSGPGVDACALAAAFPAATVVAVDSSAAMLAAATRRAEAAGLAERVESLVLDLDAEFTELGPVDLAWAALSLHHLHDRSATVERIAAQLRPGGGLCVLERYTPLQAWPADELDCPGLWERVNHAQSAWYERARASHHSHDDLQQLADVVAAAGLDVALASTLQSTSAVPASLNREQLVARHAQMALRNFGDALDSADIAALQAPDAFTRLSRSAATFTTTRLFVVASQERA